MSSEIMDQRQHVFSPWDVPSAPSSFFSDELGFSSERQIGFWKADPGTDNRGTVGMPLIFGSKAISSPLEKFPPMGENTVECVELPQAYVSKDQKTQIDLEHHLMGTESTVLSRTSWRAPNQDYSSGSSLYAQPTSQLVEGNSVNLNGVHYENGLFSSSLSVIFDKKLSLSRNVAPFGRSVDTTNFSYRDNEPFESLEEIEAQTIGDLLPDDDDDLLSGIIHDHDYIARPNNGDNIEDDLFCSGGGMELEAGDDRNSNSVSDFVGGEPYVQLGGFNVPFAGEHPCGEHPSRTIFTRNINSNVEDVELRDLFEGNSLVKDINQGTLVVFNLDSSVSNDDVRYIFGVYGKVKEIHEIPNKHHHKLIEFYDVRAAEAALRALNRSYIAGKRIKLVASRPGGAKGCSLMQQLSPELGQEETSGCKRVNPSSNSPPECFVSWGTTFGENTSNVLDSVAFQDLHSTDQPLVSPFTDSCNVHYNLSSVVRVAPVDSQSNQSGSGYLSHSMGRMNLVHQCSPAYHSRSLPEYHDGIRNGIPSNSPNTISVMDIINSRPTGVIDNRHILNVATGSLSHHLFEHNRDAFGILGNGSCPLHVHEYLMNSSDTYHRPGTMMWRNSPTFVNSIPSHPPSQMHRFPRGPSHLSNTILSLHNHHVGSAPSVNSAIWEGQHAHGGDTAEASTFHPGSLGNMGFLGSSPTNPLEQRSVLPSTGGNCIGPSKSAAHIGIPAPQQRRYIFRRKNVMSSSYDASNGRARNRRSDASANQADNKKQYELDTDRIMRGEDSRTTLMLKNIPNKYTSKMLLATIDEHHRGTYDFIYLPIDFKNKCNMGYAFINTVDPQHIIPFYQAFNGKKWEKFNSEKVASLAYARIQGRQSLIVHFQNSSLMNEDKLCRPILFHTDGPNAGDQEPFPLGTNIRSRPGRSRTPAATEETHQGSPPTSANGEEFSNAVGSRSVSTKEFE